MRDRNREIAAQQLARYGYSLAVDNQINRDAKYLGVFVSCSRDRFQARMASGALLWSGPDLGAFVASFWFAKPVAEKACTK